MRLTRSRDDVVMSGVLAGLANYFKIDPTLVRIAFVVIVFLGGGGLLIPIYIAGAFIIPKEPRQDKENKRDFNRRNRRNPRDRRRYERTNREYHRPKNEREFTREPNEIDEDDWSDF